MDTIDDLTSMLWTCTTCAESFNIFARSSHLISKQHLRKIRGLNAHVIKVDTADDPPMAMWTCEICNVAMNVFAREDHLLGADHRRMLRKRELGSRYSASVGSSAPADTTFNESYEDLNEIQALVGRLQELQPSDTGFTCHVCRESTTLATIWSHLSPAWDCDICEAKLHVGAKKEHLGQHDNIPIAGPAPSLSDGLLESTAVDKNETEMKGDDMGMESSQYSREGSEGGAIEKDDGSLENEQNSGGALLTCGYESELVKNLESLSDSRTNQSSMIQALSGSNGHCTVAIIHPATEIKQPVEGEMQLVDLLSDFSAHRHQNAGLGHIGGISEYDILGDFMERNPWQDEVLHELLRASNNDVQQAINPQISPADNENHVSQADTEPVVDCTKVSIEQEPVDHSHTGVTSSRGENDKALDELFEEGPMSLVDSDPEALLNSTKSTGEPLFNIFSSIPSNTVPEAVESPTAYAAIDAFLNQFEVTAQIQQWECEECQQAMSLSNRESHLTGKKHMRCVALARRSRTNIARNLIDMEDATVSTENADIQEMGGREDNCQDLEQGDDQVCNVDLLGEIDYRLPGVDQLPPQEIPPVNAPKPPTSSLQIVKASWTCSTCHISMDQSSKECHLSDKKHIQRAAKLTPGKSPSEISHGSSPRQWTCLLCNMTMQHRQQTEHLSGQKHLQRVKLQGSQVVIQPAIAAQPPPIAAQSPHTSWTCMICQQTMPAYSKEPHLAGIKHNEMLRESASKAGPAMSSFTQPQWRCYPCEMTMDWTARSTHVLEERHLAVVRGTPAPAMNTATIADGQEDWTCRLCDRTMMAMSKQEHLEGKKHKTMAQQRAAQHAPGPEKVVPQPVPAMQTPKEPENWTCTLCALRMHPTSKEAHLAGLRHRAALMAGPSNIQFSVSQVINPPGYTPRPNDEIYQCVICKVPHPVRVLQMPGTQVWNCDLCRTSVHLVSRDAHLASVGHRKREIEVAAGGQVIREVPKGPRAWLKEQT